MQQYIYLDPWCDAADIILTEKGQVQFGNLPNLCQPHGDWWLSVEEDTEESYDLTINFNYRGDESQLKITEFFPFGNYYRCSELQKILVLHREDVPIIIGSSFHYMHRGRITCTLHLAGNRVVYHDPRTSATCPHGKWEFKDGVLLLSFSYTGMDCRIGNIIRFHMIAPGVLRDESKARVMVLK